MPPEKPYDLGQIGVRTLDQWEEYVQATGRHPDRAILIGFAAPDEDAGHGDVGLTVRNFPGPVAIIEALAYAAKQVADEAGIPMHAGVVEIPTPDQASQN